MTTTRPTASVNRLAGELISSVRAEHQGATVFLGAGASVSSGILSWSALCQAILEEFHIQFSEQDDPVDVLVNHFATESGTQRERYLALYSKLGTATPSRGYYHIAQLASEGFISTILTTNWDSLLEQALYSLMPANRIKILIRGEVDDDRIAQFLALRSSHVVVVKLHGDLAAQVLQLTPTEMGGPSPGLTEQLQQRLRGHCLLVGQSARDMDTMGLLQARDPHGSLYYVRHRSGMGAPPVPQPIADAHARIITGRGPSVLATGEDVDLGDFDDFFTQLNLAIHVRLTVERAHTLQRVERAILDKEKGGLGYFNYTKITEMIHVFTLRIIGLHPDLVLFVNDPHASGGAELRRRMTAALTERKIPYSDIRVEGELGSRTFKRGVSSDRPDLAPSAIRRVAILDAIAFSGNTMRLTTSRVREWFPEAYVHFAALVASHQLVNHMETAPEHERIIHQELTDRHEIFFPWGTTQATASFQRRFEGVDPDTGRDIQIGKRPWGTLETLATQEVTSVRILTIEAHDELSFHRHLCRDELIVALDENIGLDICGDDLATSADMYDPRIKSIILEKGDYVLVPRGVWHRTKASMDRVRILEVAFGVYDEANDVQRLWDRYERERRQDPF